MSASCQISLASSPSKEEESDPVNNDALSKDRIDSILLGTLPCVHEPLFAAYKSALHDIGLRSDLCSHRNFQPKELCSLLRTPNGSIRKLGYRMIKNLTDGVNDTGTVTATDALKEMIKFGLLPLMIERLDVLCKSEEAKLESGLQVFSSTTAGLEALDLCDAISSIATAKVFDQESRQVYPDVTQLGLLAGVVAAMCGHFFYHNNTYSNFVFSTAILEKLTALIRSLHFFEGLWYLERGSILFEELYANQLNSKGLIKYCCKILQSMPRTEYAITSSAIIRYGTNSSQFCRSFAEAEVNGVRTTLECIGSTSHNDITLRNLLIAVGNFSSQGPDLSLMVVENQGFDLLQPVVMSDNSNIALSACYAICALAVEKSCNEVIGLSDSLIVVTDVLRMLPPGSLKMDSGWSPSDLQKVITMISPDSHPTVQLCALHWIGKSFHISRNQATFSTSSMLQLLRTVAASPDPFVYMAAIYLMRTIQAPLSTFRPFTAEVAQGKSQIPVSQWTVEMVCNWVSTKSFRCYRQLFRDGFVNGRMLLAITNDVLIEKNVSDVWHRQSILFAIDDLRESISLKSNASGGSMQQFNLEQESSAVTYDIFISYRRKGGSDFAQLLKVCFKSKGLEVFLDVDNLVQGAFDQQLWSTMGRAKNVVLVWTKGCMDRFLDGNDPTCGDFVRKEYALALKLQKNIVPVAHEEFDWPDVSRIPAEISSILGLNAVKYNGEFREASIQKITTRLVL